MCLLENQREEEQERDEKTSALDIVMRESEPGKRMEKQSKDICESGIFTGGATLKRLTVFYDFLF